MKREKWRSTSRAEIIGSLMSLGNRQAVGLDLGSVHTRCVIAEACEDELHYHGHCEVRSDGWSKGGIVNFEAVRERIWASLRGAGWNDVSRVRIGLGGWDITTYVGFSSYQLEKRRPVRLADMGLALSHANASWRRGTWDLYGELPTRWKLDGVDVHDAELIEGSVVSVETGFMYGSPMHRWELAKAITGIIGIEDYELEAVAASRSALADWEREDGALLIEVGADSSSVAFWRGGELRRVEGLMRGATQSVRDVAFDLNISFEEALLRYGNSAEAETLDRNLEFADYVALELESRGVAMSEIPEIVVVTGGGNDLLNINSALEGRLGRRVRVGRPSGIDGFPELQDAGAWCVAYGLAITAGDLVTRGDESVSSAARMANMPTQKS